MHARQVVKGIAAAESDQPRKFDRWHTILEYDYNKNTGNLRYVCSFNQFTADRNTHRALVYKNQRHEEPASSLEKVMPRSLTQGSMLRVCSPSECLHFTYSKPILYGRRRQGCSPPPARPSEVCCQFDVEINADCLSFCRNICGAQRGPRAPHRHDGSWVRGRMEANPVL